MKAEYSNDTGKGPGNGFLRITGAGPLAASDGLAFCLKRASDRQCVGHNGWQPAEVFIPAQTLNHQGDAFDIGIDSSVVDNLDPRETYRLTVRGEDGTQASATMQVFDVIFSPAIGGQGVMVTEKAPTPPPPPPAPEPEPEPEPEPAPEPEPEPAPIQQPEPSQPQKKSKLPIILLLLLLIAGGAFAAWKFLMPEDPSEAPKQEQQPPDENTPAPPKEDQEPPVEPPLSQARKYLSGSGEPAGAYDLAMKLRATEDKGADAAFLLTEDAAQKGHGPAMLLTGDFYSPADGEAHGSIEKDALLALDWYLKSKAAGETQADERIGALKSWAEKEAAAGSELAKELLAKIGQQ